METKSSNKNPSSVDKRGRKRVEWNNLMNLHIYFRLKPGSSAHVPLHSLNIIHYSISFSRGVCVRACFSEIKILICCYCCGCKYRPVNVASFGGGCDTNRWERMQNTIYRRRRLNGNTAHVHNRQETISRSRNATQFVSNNNNIENISTAAAAAAAAQRLKQKRGKKCS